MESFIPSEYQPPLDPSRHIVQIGEADKGESADLDVLFVGAGPASLAAAIKLADLAKARKKEISIGIMEKADQLGGHTLSGAAINPLLFRWLFPEKKDSDFPFRKKITKESFRFLTKSAAIPFPVPPGMGSKGCWTASLCEAVRWLGAEAEKRDVHIFTSFPADKLLMKGNRAVGAATKPFGLNKDGSKEGGSEPASNLFAKALVLSEGCRGHLTQAWLAREGIGSKYPQTYALGVKEIWEVKSEPEGILHTLGWPLGFKTFGGSWLYPMGGNLISLGLVAGLDSPSGDLSIHDKLQMMKEHPLFASLLKGGKCIEWGAKTIPEGGWHALPRRLHGEGLLIIGDSAGFLNMNSLKGIHYAMASGVFAAETLMGALERDDFSKASLCVYDEKIKGSFIKRELYSSRNLRQSFHKGLFSGLLRAGIISLTGGRWPTDFPPEKLKPDGEAKKIFTASHQKTSIEKTSLGQTSLEPSQNARLPARALEEEQARALEEEQARALAREREAKRAQASKTENSQSEKLKEAVASNQAFHLDKTEAVYLSGNKTRDKIPSHLTLGKGLSQARGHLIQGRFYERMCPAGVYEQRDRLIVRAPNCIDCKATDILGPRWSPRERGSGPNYRLM